MMSSAEGGKIAGWKIQIWTELRSSIKANLDSKIIDPFTESARCDKEVMPIALKIRAKNLQLWGYGFDKLQKRFFYEMRASTGI